MCNYVGEDFRVTVGDMAEMVGQLDVRATAAHREVPLPPTYICLKWSYLTLSLRLCELA